jgi:hypothetical protein
MMLGNCTEANIAIVSSAPYIDARQSVKQHDASSLRMQRVDAGSRELHQVNHAMIFQPLIKAAPAYRDSLDHAIHRRLFLYRKVGVAYAHKETSNTHSLTT